HLLHRARQAAPTSEEEPTLKVGEQHQTARQPISTLYGYQMDGQQVVTVYVRDLPIISFVEQPELDTPLERATALVAQLNQMAQGSLKGTTITLDWTEPDSQAEKASPIYAIHVNDTELLRIDNGVMLVDGQRQVDTALLATNRLRRLLLDAPPIQAPALPQSATLVATAHQPEQPKTSLQQAATPATPYKVGMVQEGIASWYDLHKTRHEMTAAHPTLPFGTQVRVTNVENGRQAIVRINDRGPFIPGRIIDVSLRAAEVLGMVRSGVVPVRVEVLQP
ncbi:MAG: septal ring lytic transglycosylase RlpA family protein, partial [Thermostichus sp. DG_1_6_bins_120]